jgi:hypothetical protein
MSWAIISKLIETTLKQCLFLAQWNYICVIQTTIISNPMEQKNQPQLFVTQWNTKSTTQLFLASWMANKCNHNHFEGVSGRKGFLGVTSQFPIMKDAINSHYCLVCVNWFSHSPSPFHCFFFICPFSFLLLHGRLSLSLSLSLIFSHSNFTYFNVPSEFRVSFHVRKTNNLKF